MHEIHCYISGLVQMVAYRAYAQDSATYLGIAGWVRNLPDGRVEVQAQGDREVLKEFIEYLNEGSLLSKVESIEVDWGTAGEIYSDFSIKYE
ncbi:acylphosphatase [bacterium]|nr:acylphosphatase [bacterium]